MIYVFPHRYEYLRSLAIQGKDAVGANLGDSTGPDSCIFEDMDPVWLRTVWEDGGTARADMIEILISLAMLKL